MLDPLKSVWIMTLQ